LFPFFIQKIKASTPEAKTRQLGFGFRRMTGQVGEGWHAFANRRLTTEPRIVGGLLSISCG
jgi:hypothetical protein